MKSGNYRISKTIIDTDNYCGFKLRYRDAFADRYVMRDMLGRDYARIPPNPKIVIDIGAHIGLFTLAAIRVGAKKIYAFEPEASNYEILCHNMKINGYANRVMCINKGVGTPGEAKLFIHPTNSGGSSTYTGLYKGLDLENYQTINLISIHDVFNIYDIKYCDLLKSDCEGSERDIIDELDEALINKIGQVSVEFHDRKLIDKYVNRLRKWYQDVECTNREQGYKGGTAWVFKRVTN